MTDIRWFDQLTERDRSVYGGKAWRLAQMAQAGIPVPAGFCIGERALVPLDGNGILSAYGRLGGVVAVRSSSAAEDGSCLSFAGQFDSVLNVEGDAALLEAIVQCWRSRHSRRNEAYRRHVMESGDAPMAVIVQRCIPSDLSGVLFTRHPHDDAAMLLEAAGDRRSDVQSGRGVSTSCALDRQTGESRSGRFAPLPTAQLQRLYRFGMQIESLLGCASDIEWLEAGDQIYIVQARPITTPSVAQREALRWQEIEKTLGAAAGEKTVWVQDQLTEGLPAPTPMTWALLERLLAADGDFGQLYRAMGIAPDDALGDRTAYDLIAGRPYLNLNRVARMQFGELPVGYSFEKIKASPATALAPRPEWRSDQTGLRTWLRLPRVLWKFWRMSRTLEAAYARLPEVFRKSLPANSEMTEFEKDASLETRTSDELRECLNVGCRNLLPQLRERLFQPAALAEHALVQLRMAMPTDSAEKQIAELLSTVQIDPPANVAGAIADLSAGRLSEPEFRKAFGHRADCEWELAMPRYAEWEGPIVPPGGRAIARAGVREFDFAKLPVRARVWARRLVEFAALRETAKHHFLRGYAVIRRILLELDRRLSLDGGIFFLTPQELDQRDLPRLAADRRRHWAALRSLSAPTVLFSDDLEQIGRSQAPAAPASCIRGVPLSVGQAEAPAMVFVEPDDRRPTQPYVLVCPHCDPVWTPLLLNARAAVFETGGLLSHGAIVAREFGIPAVGAAHGATQRIRTGQMVRVDGAAGTVSWPPSLDGQPIAREY